MKFVLAIWAVLQALPPFFGDRTENATTREFRLAEVARAIDLAAEGNVRVAAQLIELGWAETRFASYVEIDCEHGPYKCDIKNGKSRAAGYWQLWERTCPVAHNKTLGSGERAEAGAECAAQRMRAGLAICKTVSGAYAYYRAGGCQWLLSAERAQGQARFEQKLRAELAKND